MIERQVGMIAAILAGELVTQKNIEPREGRVARGLYVSFERHNRRQFERGTGAVDNSVIFRNDIHPVQKHRLDGILPRPQRKGIVTQRPEIGIEN